MPEIKDYMEKTKIFAHQNGYVETPFGRKCSVFGINNENKAIVAMAERAAINAPIRGGAADLVKLAMQRVDFALKNSCLDARILLQVHDELVVEAKESDAPKVAELMRRTMENIPELKIKMPVDAQISDNWADAH
jgi:DNA polymerase-1